MLRFRPSASANIPRYFTISHHSAIRYHSMSYVMPDHLFILPQGEEDPLEKELKEMESQVKSHKAQLDRSDDSQMG